MGDPLPRNKVRRRFPRRSFILGRETVLYSKVVLIIIGMMMWLPLVQWIRRLIREAPM